MRQSVHIEAPHECRRLPDLDKRLAFRLGHALFVDPGTQDFYSLNHFVGACEVIRQAVPGREIGYGTRDGLSKYVRPAVEDEAVRIF